MRFSWQLCIEYTIFRVANYEKSQIYRNFIAAEYQSTTQAMDNGSWRVSMNKDLGVYLINYVLWLFRIICLVDSVLCFILLVYMISTCHFSDRPSVCLSVRPYVHPSVHLCILLCFLHLRNSRAKLQIFYACWLWSWLIPVLIVLHCIMYFQFCEWHHVFTCIHKWREDSVTQWNQCIDSNQVLLSDKDKVIIDCFVLFYDECLSITIHRYFLLCDAAQISQLVQVNSWYLKYTNLLLSKKSESEQLWFIYSHI